MFTSPHLNLNIILSNICLNLEYTERFNFNFKCSLQNTETMEINNIKMVNRYSPRARTLTRCHDERAASVFPETDLPRTP